jgi:hypothetical protein
MQDALLRIAELAPTLKESEFRVLVELSARAAATGTTNTKASSRDLANATKLSRPNVQSGIDSLNRRRIITSDSGSATAAATHELEFLRTVPIGRGSITEPPPTQQVALFQSQGGFITEPPLALLQSQGGFIAEPPLIQRATRAPTSSDFDFDSIRENIDRYFERLLKAKPSDYDAARLAEVERQMHGYQAKFGRLKNPHPPDPQICAQLLAVAEWPRLQGMFYELMAERKQPGDSYAWYVTVAVQRCWSITPEQQRKYREQFALIKSGTTAVANPAADRAATTETQFGTGEMKRALAAAAQRKAMR